MLTAWFLRLKIIPDDIIITKVKENMQIGQSFWLESTSTY